MAVSNKPTVAQPAPRPKVVAPNAADIVAAIAGRMPSESVEMGGYRWTLTIPRSAANAWMFSKLAAQTDDQTMSQLGSDNAASAGFTKNLAQLSLALVAPSVAASLSHFGTPVALPEGANPDELPVEQKWNMIPIGQMFPLVDTRPDADPTVPRIAEFGDVELCDVVHDFLIQLPDPVVQYLATVASDLQKQYNETSNKASSKSFPKAQPANS